MSGIENISVAPTLRAPARMMRRVEPHHLLNFHKCEISINHGIFFDGTRNNNQADRPTLAQTNIARLFDAYVEINREGFYRTYIPGVGTPFPEIGEAAESTLGQGFGIGCEQRVLFALLAFINSLHSCAFETVPFLTKPQVRALCRTQSIYTSIAYTEDVAQLRGLGLSCGLRMPDFLGDGERDTILSDMCKSLERKLERGRPRIKECFIDVFGFSRGAAEARVFCNWLNRLLVGGKLAGVIIRFRFLGIFDTVAAAGFWDGTLAGIVGTTASHRGWATPDFLQIPRAVENCVHMIAMHELRRNFPIDAIGTAGALSPGFCQVVYPGTHSDVGGGYAPRELGIAIEKNLYVSDSLKLSQIPLNHMRECAVAAGAPIRVQYAADDDGYDQFAIAPRLEKAYAEFLTASSLSARPLHQWLQPYLNWRWQQRKTFSSLTHVQKADPMAQALLMKFNRTFIEQGDALERSGSKNFWELMAAVGRNVLFHRNDAMILSELDKEARPIYDIARAAGPTPPALHALFDGFVHDSLAGFDMQSLERGGHWRYRKAFQGSDRVLIGANDQPRETEMVA